MWDELQGGDNVYPVTPKQHAPGERPFFTDDRKFARWIIDNPDQVTPDDESWLKEKLGNKSFRLWLGVENSDDIATIA